jgi:glutathione S-transferase
MLRSPFVMGESYGIADPYLFTLSQWLEGDGVDLSSIPRVVEHRARMRERPSVMRALEEERAGRDLPANPR